MVASVPLLVKRTVSAVGTMRQTRSAASASAGVLDAKCEPVAIALVTAETIRG